MKKPRQQPEETAPNGNAGWPVSRTLLWGAAILVVLALTLVVALRLWRSSTATTGDPYAAIPFRPRVVYDSLNVIVSNTEEEPYLDTRLNLYVGAIVYSVQVGTMRPGESITRSLHTFTNKHGESFDPAIHKAGHLEVSARFGGYDVHKDLPPPR